MFSRKRSPAILPCLPRTAQRPPKGAGWIHEVKHDGFRIIARRDAKGVRLFTRNGYDFTARFPKIVDAVASLSVRSCVVDGEAIVVDERGLSVFDDLRWVPLEDRKQTLGDLIRGIDDGIAFNQHFDGDGEIIFRHACSLGCEGIVSKRLGSAYRSGRVNHWLKIKNPAAPAVRREAEEDWSGKRATAGGTKRIDMSDRSRRSSGSAKGGNDSETATSG